MRGAPLDLRSLISSILATILFYAVCFVYAQVFVAVCGLSLWLPVGRYSSLVFGALLAQTQCGLCRCGIQTSIAPLHVGSSQTRDQIWVPYIGRLILPLDPTEAPIYDSEC